MRTTSYSYISNTVLALGVVFLSMLPAVSQTTAEPGTPVTIGAATDVSESVSDCGGLNSCGVEYNGAANTMGAVTALSGIGSNKTARVSLLNRFEVSGDNDRALGARLSGNVSWSGDLESFGAIGASAYVNVRMSVVDVMTGLTVGGQTLLDEECETFLLLDSCLRRISGSRAVNLPFQVQRGREYEIRFSLECESNSGVGDANCVFNQNGAFPLAGGQVSRTDLTLNVEADIVGLLEEIRDGVDMLKDDVAALRGEVAAHDAEVKAQLSLHDAHLADHDVRLAEHETAEEERFHILLDASDRNFGAMLESIRLLLTPQGRRATELPVCDGEPCAFPDGAQAGSNGSCDNSNGNGNCGNGQEGVTGDISGEVGGDSDDNPAPALPDKRRPRNGR